MSLCYRCEHRARFLETGERPRYECGEVNQSKVGCYMYRPVSPCVVAADEGDDRELGGPAMCAARAHFVRVAEGSLRGMIKNDELVQWFVPAEAVEPAKTRPYPWWKRALSNVFPAWAGS